MNPIQYSPFLFRLNIFWLQGNFTIVGIKSCSAQYNFSIAVPCLRKEAHKLPVKTKKSGFRFSSLNPSEAHAHTGVPLNGGRSKAFASCRNRPSEEIQHNRYRQVGERIQSQEHPVNHTKSVKFVFFRFIYSHNLGRGQVIGTVDYILFNHKDVFHFREVQFQILFIKLLCTKSCGRAGLRERAR